MLNIYLLNLHVCGREASEKELRKNMKRMEFSKISFIRESSGNLL